ncbi:MAG: DUF4199 domain-containing protein [Flavobacteriaceae bacterium]|nr:DUF4199 domain-containing protein [Flavobacteriaceae bacterium]
MENQTNPTSAKQIMLNYGLIFGFVSILISVTNYALGNIYEPHWSVSVVGILIMVVAIVLGLKQFKKNNNELLSLSQSFKIGLGIALIGAIISIIYTVLFAKFIEPNYINNVIELQQTKMIESSPEVSDEVLEMMANGTKKYFYVATIGMIVIANLFLGFVFSLIAGLIMKKTDEEITSI